MGEIEGAEPEIWPFDALPPLAKGAAAVRGDVVTQRHHLFEHAARVTLKAATRHGSVSMRQSLARAGDTYVSAGGSDLRCFPGLPSRLPSQSPSCVPVLMSDLPATVRSLIRGCSSNVRGFARCCAGGGAQTTSSGVCAGPRRRDAESARARADSAFDRFIAIAVAAGAASSASRAPPSIAATRGLTPDYSLPDLAIPGRPEKPAAQPEFVQTPAQYLRPATFKRLAAQGRRLAAKYRGTLRRIEKEFGVPGDVVLAIWARETDYGRYPLPHDAIRVLATQGFVGKRKDFFRQQFLQALKMLQDGIPRADMRSSWGGALGHDPVPAVGLFQIRRRFRPQRPRRHLAFGAGRAGLGRQAAQGARLADRRALGDRSASAEECRLHRRRAGGALSDRRMDRPRL